MRYRADSRRKSGINEKINGRWNRSFCGILDPSLRTLAKELKVSVLTTTRAYSELELEGFVINIQGKGCYVLGQHTELAREQFLREIEAHLQEVIKIAKCANVSNEELHELLNILVEG